MTLRAIAAVLLLLAVAASGQTACGPRQTRDPSTNACACNPGLTYDADLGDCVLTPSITTFSNVSTEVDVTITGDTIAFTYYSNITNATVRQDLGQLVSTVQTLATQSDLASVSLTAGAATASLLSAATQASLSAVSAGIETQVASAATKAQTTSLSNLLATVSSEVVSAASLSSVVAVSGAVSSVSSLATSLSSTLSSTSSQVVTLQSSTATIFTDISAQTSCAKLGKDYDTVAQACYSRPNLGVYPLSFSGCSNANSVVYSGDILVWCDSNLKPQYFSPTVLGTVAALPAPNCSSLYNAGQPDGYYYINSTGSSTQTYCRRGVSVTYWPSWALNGMEPPIAYWSFDNTLTEHMNNFQVTLAGASPSTQYKAGRIGQAHQFNGNTYYTVKIPQYVFSGPVSISAWVNFDVVDGNDNQIFGNGNTVGVDDILHTILRTNQFYSGLFGDDVNSQNTALINTWYHVVWTFDAQDNRGIFVNGVPIVTSGFQMAITVPSPDGSSDNHYTGYGLSYIGAISVTGYGQYQNMRGRIDDFMIFDYALSWAQVTTLFEQVPLPANQSSCASLYQAGYPPGFYNNLANGTNSVNSRVFCRFGAQQAPSPFAIAPSPLQSAPYAYWAFEGNLLDSVGLNNLTVYRSSVSYTSVNTINGQAMYWTNAAGNLNLQIPFLTNALMIASWSLSLWANLARVNTGVDNPFMTYGLPTAEQGLQCNERGGNPYLGFWGDDDDITTVTLPTNTWFHLVFVKNANSQYIYYNGDEIGVRGSNSFSGPSSTQPVLLGGSTATLYSSWYFGGLMDEVAFFTRAITTDEAAFMMQAVHY
jgi:hypothetical protein